jgi:hypothetical protein
MKTIACISVVALASGCALFTPSSPVPATRVSGSIGGIPFTLEAPKQVSAKGVELDMTVATNTFRLRIAELSSVNDPQVIDKASAGRIAETKAMFDGFNGLAGKLVEGAAKGANPIP